MSNRQNPPLRCTCGAVQGEVSHSGRASRGVCYCKDCQSFAHFLGRPGDILDAQGGSDVIAVLPQWVAITRGKDKLACMSLSDKGMLRWYAACCNTPIGNTLRSSKFSYVGLVHTCLRNPPSTLDQDYGPVRMRVNTQSAKGEPKPKNSPVSMFFSVLGLMIPVLGARLSGSYMNTPFFDAQGTPIARPKELTREERERLRAVL